MIEVMSFFVPHERRDKPGKDKLGHLEKKDCLIEIDCLFFRLLCEAVVFLSLVSVNRPHALAA
jgi:hypothetical protein